MDTHDLHCLYGIEMEGGSLLEARVQAQGASTRVVLAFQTPGQAEAHRRKVATKYEIPLKVVRLVHRGEFGSGLKR